MNSIENNRVFSHATLLPGSATLQRGAIQSECASDEWFFSEALRCVYWIWAGITVVVESAGRCALLRVPRPLRELLLYLRKAHHPTDSASDWVRRQGEF
ncbi:MAG: hypothetical protein KKI03_00490, partial [Gammaproteobacteria bacterium]|nr:hypothetical protein [Gammaproteobacteria bacterium]